MAAADAGRALSPRAARSAPICSRARTARGSSSCRCRPRDASRSRSRCAMIDAVDVRLAPLDKRAAPLRPPPGRLPGAAGRALRDRRADARHDPRRARRHAPVLILARGGPLRRDGHHRARVRSSAARQGTSPAKDRPPCAGRCMRPHKPPAGPAPPTATTTCRPPSDSAATAPAWRSRANCSNAATTPYEDLGEEATRARMTTPRARNASRHADAPRPAPGIPLPPRSRGRPPKTERPHRLPQREHTPSPSCRRPGANPRPWTEISMGARAHTTSPNSASTAPVKRYALGPPRAASWAGVTGSRRWRLHHNEWSEGASPPEPRRQHSHPKGLDKTRLHR